MNSLLEIPLSTHMSLLLQNISISNKTSYLGRIISVPEITTEDARP